MDFAYKRALCASMKTEGVDPDQSLLETLEAHISKARTAIVRRVCTRSPTLLIL